MYQAIRAEVERLITHLEDINADSPMYHIEGAFNEQKLETLIASMMIFDIMRNESKDFENAWQKYISYNSNIKSQP
jgi:hypothetical protein